MTPGNAESKVGQRIVTSAEKLMEPTVWWRCVECKKALGYAPTYWGRDGRSGPPCIYCGAVTEQIERPTPCGTS